jgi:hypothetical protein
MLAESDTGALLRSMANEADVVAAPRPSRAGKGKALAIQPARDDDVPMFARGHTWDAEEDVVPTPADIFKPFPIMELPTEIRLEIYRACLTRPYNILLSKRDQPPMLAKEAGDAPSFLDASNVTVGEDGTGGEDRSQDTTGPNAPSRIISSSAASGSVNRMATSRANRTIRMIHNRSALAPSNPSPDASASSTTGGFSYNSGRRATTTSGRRFPDPEPERLQNQDPLIANILRTSKEVYKEARSILYAENHFDLDLNTAMTTLGHLHQRSRRQIKHIEICIPSYNEILERFQETVRLSLRYCLGLKKFVISMPFTLPGADGSGTTGNTTVYANGFDILRWLPQECDIILKGNVCAEIETVVNKHLHLAKTLDKVSRHKLQWSMRPFRAFFDATAPDMKQLPAASS